MKEGWEYKTLGAVCDLYQPKTISTKEMVSDGLYDVFGANGKIGKYHSYNHENPEILMTCRGATCGNINISSPKSWINGNAMVVHIKDEEKLDRQFLVYSLIHVDKAHIITGAAQPQITRQTLSPLEIGYPSITEQQAIVDYLDSAFTKIDAMKENAEKALNEAKALFQALLKKMLEPKEGWEEKKLKNIVISITDGDHQPPPKSNDGIPFITISNIDKNSNKIVFENTFYVPQSYFGALKKDRIPQNGDVLYTVTGSFGIPVLIDFQKDFCFQRHIALIRPNIDMLSPTYLFYWILSSYATSQAEDTATGAAQRTVSLNSLRNFNIHVPPLSEQQAIVATLDSFKSKVERLQENFNKISQECDALKQAILRQVFE